MVRDYSVSTDEQKRSLNAAKCFIKRFEKGQQFGEVLVFLGGYGTGKTLLATLILQAIAPKHGGLYTEASEIIQSVRRSWRKESRATDMELIAHYANQALLVIDEVGAQYSTQGEQRILTAVLGQRYTQLKPTIIATNCTHDELKPVLGERIINRLDEVATWVPFVWESFRKPTRRKSSGGKNDQQGE
jgi:DNA replication protein DnaC